MKQKELSEMSACEHVEELIRLAVKQARDGGCQSALELAQAAHHAANARSAICSTLFEVADINPDKYDDR